MDGTTELGSVQLQNGRATLTTSTLHAGSNVIKADYDPASGFRASAASVVETVRKPRSTPKAVLQRRRPCARPSWRTLTPVASSRPIPAVRSWLGRPYNSRPSDPWRWNHRQRRRSRQHWSRPHGLHQKRHSRCRHRSAESPLIRCRLSIRVLLRGADDPATKKKLPRRSTRQARAKWPPLPRTDRRHEWSCEAEVLSGPESSPRTDSNAGSELSRAADLDTALFGGRRRPVLSRFGRIDRSRSPRLIQTLPPHLSRVTITSLAGDPTPKVVLASISAAARPPLPSWHSSQRRKSRNSPSRAGADAAPAIYRSSSPLPN